MSEHAFVPSLPGASSSRGCPPSSSACISSSAARAPATARAAVQPEAAARSSASRCPQSLWRHEEQSQARELLSSFRSPVFGSTSPRLRFQVNQRLAGEPRTFLVRAIQATSSPQDPSGDRHRKLVKVALTFAASCAAAFVLRAVRAGSLDALPLPFRPAALGIGKIIAIVVASCLLAVVAKFAITADSAEKKLQTWLTPEKPAAGPTVGDNASWYRRSLASGIARASGLMNSPPPDLSSHIVLARESSGRAKKKRSYVIQNGKLTAVADRDDRPVLERFRDLVTTMYLPLGFPDSVTPDYWHFTVWQFIQNFAASACSVISTQALLRAVGLSAGKAIPTAATLNWVLKDGIGRIGAMIFGSLFGNCFDNDPKRWRLAGDALYDMGMGLEILSPLVPSFFLLTASTANAAKTISYMMRLPPRAAIFRSFAGRENLGDISAKYNSQEVAANLAGMGLGIALSTVVGVQAGPAFAAYALLVSTHLYANYRSLKDLRLPTLNWERMLVLLRSYVEGGRIPEPLEVNHAERILYLPGTEQRQIHFGAALEDIAENAEELGQLMLLYRDEKYMVNWRDGRAVCVVKGNANTMDLLKCLLQAGRLYQRMQGLTGLRPATANELELRSSGRVLEESYAFAQARFGRFYRALEQQGWNVTHVLFEPGCRVSYDTALVLPALGVQIPEERPEHVVWEGSVPSQPSNPHPAAFAAAAAAAAAGGREGGPGVPSPNSIPPASR
eukprot:tig00020675_g12662.t1